MNIEDCFKPNKEVAELAIAAHSGDPSTRLDLNSTHMPDLNGPIDTEEVRKTISERFTRYLGNLARYQSIIDGKPEGTLINSEKRFTDKIISGIRYRLHLDQSSPHYKKFLDDYAGELYDTLSANKVQFGFGKVIKDRDDKIVLYSSVKVI